MPHDIFQVPRYRDQCQRTCFELDQHTSFPSSILWTAFKSQRAILKSSIINETSGKPQDSLKNKESHKT